MGKNNICIIGGPRNAEEAFGMLNERMGKFNKVAIRGDIDIVRNRRWGVETITMYLSHDQGYDPIYRFQKVRSWFGMGPVVAYQAQKETFTAKGKLEWKNVHIHGAISSNENGFNGLNIFWYSALFALNSPKQCSK